MGKSTAEKRHARTTRALVFTSADLNYRLTRCGDRLTTEALRSALQLRQAIDEALAIADPRPRDDAHARELFLGRCGR